MFSCVRNEIKQKNGDFRWKRDDEAAFRKLNLDSLVFGFCGRAEAAETASLAFPVGEAAPGSNGFDGGRLSLVRLPV